MKRLLFLAVVVLLPFWVLGQHFEWAKTMGGPSFDMVYSIDVDAAGNVYSTGSFEGTVDFDPGLGIFNLKSMGGTDIFVSKLDSNGNFVWAKAMGGTSFDEFTSIAVDATGNVFTTGFFRGTVDFDPGPVTFNLTSLGYGDIFISKLDADGKFVWAKAMGGTSFEGVTSIAIDATGNVFTTGFFWGTVDFDPGPGTFNLTSIGDGDIFISKLDTNGDFLWAKTMGGTSSEGSLKCTPKTGQVNKVDKLQFVT